MNEYEKTLLTILFYVCIVMFFFVPALCIIFCKRNVYFFGKKNSRNPIRDYYSSPVIKYRAFSPMGCTRKQSFDDTWYMSRQPDYKSLLQDNEKRNDYLSMSV